MAEPALLSAAFARASKDEVGSVVRQALANFPGTPPEAWLLYLSTDVREIQLSHIRQCLQESARIASVETEHARALADFLAFQSLTILVPHPFETDPNCPPDLRRLFEWGASRLHAYGRAQSQCLASLAKRLAYWCKQQAATSVDVIDCPLGGTIPAQVIARSLEAEGIHAQVREFLAPRLDRHGKRHSIKAAAREFCSHLSPGTNYVIFPDEVISGTRFLKLYAALQGHLNKRLIPVTLEVRDQVQRPPRREQLMKLRNLVAGCDAAQQGAPTRTFFPPAELIQVDHGSPFVTNAPFFWGELDIGAGKRKINFVFGLINEFREIAENLRASQSDALRLLLDLQRYSSDGSMTVGHEPFTTQIVHAYIPHIDWTIIEEHARREFPIEYLGGKPAINQTWVVQRFDWILKEVYEQMLPHCSSSSPPNEAHVVVNALGHLFTIGGGWKRRRLPQDRDFCEYTLQYEEPFSAFNQELVRLVLENAP